MVSFIMTVSVHHARAMEANRQMLNHIIPIGWLLIAIITLVFIYVCYQVNSNRPAALSESMRPEPVEPVRLNPVNSEGPNVLVRVEVGEVAVQIDVEPDKQFCMEPETEVRGLTQDDVWSDF